MKKWMMAGACAALVLLACFKIGLFEQTTTAEQTADHAKVTSESMNDTATSTPETETFIKVGKGDRTLYTDASFTTPLATVNGGELTEYLSKTAAAYQVRTSDGYTGYLSTDDGTEVTKTIQEVPSDLSDAVIVLDPGHGGSDTGALSNDEQTEEKTITLSTAKKVKAELEKAGATVYLTHTADELVPLADICTYSEKKQADVFISLHADSTEYANEATGITTYYYYGEEKSLAQSIANSFSDLPLESRGVETGNYQVLRENLQPSVLVEMGYMNNDEDLSELTSDTYQQQIAESLTRALTDYFK